MNDQDDDYYNQDEDDFEQDEEYWFGNLKAHKNDFLRAKIIWN